MVRNAKSKIKRVEKKFGINLSDKVPLIPLEDMSTRREFNAWKQIVSSFTNRNNLNYQFEKNQYGVVATKAELSRAKRKNKEAQRLAKQEIRKIENKPFIQNQKSTGFTVGQRMLMMGKENAGGISVPPDFNFNDIRFQSDLKQKLERIERKANTKHYEWRKELMRNNFISGLEKQFNSDADAVVEALRNIPPDDFFEMYMQYEELDFDYIYDPEQEQTYVGKIAGVISRYKEGLVDMDFKGF